MSNLPDRDVVQLAIDLQAYLTDMGYHVEYSRHGPSQRMLRVYGRVLLADVTIAQDGIVTNDRFHAQEQLRDRISLLFKIVHDVAQTQPSKT